MLKDDFDPNQGCLFALYVRRQILDCDSRKKNGKSIKYNPKNYNYFMIFVNGYFKNVEKSVYRYPSSAIIINKNRSNDLERNLLEPSMIFQQSPEFYAVPPTCCDRVLY